MLNTPDILATIDLNPYMNVTLCDQTRHYFGGYYHVKVLAYSDVPLVETFFGSNAEFMDARDRLGESVRFERILEKMAVPENEKAAVRGQLVDAFNETTLTYLAAPDFAGRFVRSCYLKCCKKQGSQRFSGF